MRAASANSTIAYSLVRYGVLGGEVLACKPLLTRDGSAGPAAAPPILSLVIGAGARVSNLRSAVFPPTNSTDSG